MLVILDVSALPPQVQKFLARAFRERRLADAPATEFDVQLAVTAVLPPSGVPALVDPALSALFGDSCAPPIRLPRLRERREDLRSVLTDAIAREGLRTLGAPVGIEQAAYARLCSYDFPGDDAELVAIAASLVAGCDGQTVRLDDVERLRVFQAEPFAIHGPFSADVHFPKNPS
jgi:transcriptional regulator with AAA-type ATPase domain